MPRTYIPVIGVEPGRYTVITDNNPVSHGPRNPGSLKWGSLTVTMASETF